MRGQIVKEGDVNLVFDCEDLFNFLVMVLHTGVTFGACDGPGAKMAMTGGKSVFALIVPAQMAIVVLTLENNYDLWTERSSRKDQPQDQCHKRK